MSKTKLANLLIVLQGGGGVYRDPANSEVLIKYWGFSRARAIARPILTVLCLYRKIGLGAEIDSWSLKDRAKQGQERTKYIVFTSFS